MIISTTSQLEGRPIADYLGVVSSESVQGINFVRDFFTRFRDFFGGRSQTLESALREAREQAAVILHKVGLGHALDKYPSQLSGGMQQRLAIAQALIMKPRVLLLDEPFGALDPGIRKDMHGLLLELWHETKLTVFMVTHDLSEGFSLGTRLLVFDKVRVDPHAPGAYGARITYDIPLNSDRRAQRAAVDALPPLAGALRTA